jgi:hypothetical protein
VSPPTPDHPARAEYEERLARNRATLAACAARGRRIGSLRLACFAAAVAALVAIGVWDVSAHVLWLPIAAFVWLITIHAQVGQSQSRAERAAALYASGLARLDGDWAGRGRDGARWCPARHVYASDLDLFGRGSLFELLCRARSPVGEERLAAWLLAPAAPEAVRARQSAVEEVRDAVDFREELALVEGEVSTALEHSAASTWAAAPPPPPPRIPGRVHLGVGAISAVLLVGWLAAGWNPALMLASMAVQFALARPYRARVQATLEAADRPGRDLALMGRLLDRVERAPFASAHLRTQQARLRTNGQPPSARIERLTRLTDFAEARLNQIFLPISWLFSLGTQLAFAIERWRVLNGAALPIWLDVLADIEALSSLAGHAYENPKDPFPDILQDGPVFAARRIRHPLLPPGRAVPNDVHIEAGVADAPQALVVSGSNMSGKSTFLRTVGVNAVLAWAGAPVRATALRISPLAIGASIRINDSLLEGASRFYAEIERLKAIVDVSASSPPALFLLDEILHGTNSHDRRIGAEAVVRTLLRNGGIGLVTTHDLALAEIAESGDLPLANVHFEDHMEEGRMAFDYRLRRGVVTHSNALDLMRAVGLEVSDTDA